MCFWGGGGGGWKDKKKNERNTAHKGFGITT
jgi:hypothetical protein